MAAINWALLGLATGWLSDLVHEDGVHVPAQGRHTRAGRRRGTHRRHRGRRLRAPLVQPCQVRQLAHRDRGSRPVALDPDAGAKALAAREDAA